MVVTGSDYTTGFVVSAMSGMWRTSKSSRGRRRSSGSRSGGSISTLGSTIRLGTDGGTWRTRRRHFQRAQ